MPLPLYSGDDHTGEVTIAICHNPKNRAIPLPSRIPRGAANLGEFGSDGLDLFIGRGANPRKTGEHIYQSDRGLFVP
jgi:hypothetical protein